MAIFSKIMQFFGAGTVKVSLETSGEVQRASGMCPGKITLVAKSDQEVISVNVKLVEVWQIGKGESRTMKEFELGKSQVSDKIVMKSGEVLTFEFSLPFSTINSRNDDYKEKGGVVGALGKVGSLLDGEKSNFWLTATADVRGAAFDPNDTKQIKLM